MLRRLTFFLAALSLLSCTSHKYEIKYPIVAEESSDELLMQLINLYPPEFKMVHHVLFKIHDREFDFSGYFLMHRPDAFHGAAYAEAGSAIFEFQNGPEGAQVQAKPDLISEDAIINGIMQDLTEIYRKLDKADSHLVFKDPEYRIFSFGDPEKIVHEYKMKKDGGLVSSLTAMDGHIVREIIYGEPKKICGMAKSHSHKN